MTDQARCASIRLLLALSVAAAVVAGPALAQDQGKVERPKLNDYQPPRPTLFAASHVLVQWADSQRAAPTVTRTKAEALERAQMVAAKARDGEAFAELAKTYSDGPSGPTGGSLGSFSAQQMVPEFSRAVAGLEAGQISAPVESPFGYHVILRAELELVSARHILIMHTESQRKPVSVTRTKAEALELASSLQRRARAGEEFATLAETYSDGPSKTRGGDLGSFPRGRMVKAFDAAAFKLEVKSISDVVETPFGYHVILRYE